MLYGITGLLCFTVGVVCGALCMGLCIASKDNKDDYIEYK